MKNFQLMFDIGLSSGIMAHQSGNKEFEMFANNEKMLKIKNHEREMEKHAKSILDLEGFNVDKYRDYIFGKSIAFALCFGSGLDGALRIGHENSNKMKLFDILKNKKVVYDFISCPDKYEVYKNLVSLVYAGKIEDAREMAVKTWKIQLEKNVKEDSKLLDHIKINGSAKGYKCFQAALDSELKAEIETQIGIKQVMSLTKWNFI